MTWMDKWLASANGIQSGLPGWLNDYLWLWHPKWTVEYGSYELVSRVNAFIGYYVLYISSIENNYDCYALNRE